MFKRIIGVSLAALTLAGCSAAPATNTPAAVTYSLPKDCNIKALVDVDPSYEIVDQTAEGVTDSIDCAIGVPNSDVGVFFGYSVRTESQWTAVTAALKDEGYETWDAGFPGVDVWRMQEGDAETGASCRISGHVGEVSFSVTEPWTECDEKWNKQMVGYLLEHAKQ